MSIDSLYSELNQCLSTYNKRKCPLPSHLIRKVRRIVNDHNVLIQQTSCYNIPTDLKLAEMVNELSSYRHIGTGYSRSLSQVADCLSYTPLILPLELWKSIFDCYFSFEELNHVPTDVSKEWFALVTQAKCDRIKNRKLQIKDFPFLNLNKLINYLGSLGKKLTYVDLKGLSVRSSHIELLVNKCPKITHLFLESYFIYDSDFENITNLKKLKKLSLNDASLAKVPSSIVKLTGLKQLSLRSCQSIRQLPEEIVQLTQLTKLDFASTGLRGLPEGFEKLTHLRELILDGCISFEYPKVIQFPSLKIFSALKINGINEDAPIIPNRPALQTLVINEPQISILQELEYVSSLTDLQITSYTLKQFPSRLKGLTQLKTLRLKLFSSTEHPSLEAFSSLTHLYLCSYHAKEIDSSIFDLKLEVLELQMKSVCDKNFIHKVSNITTLKTLSLLGMSVYKISSDIQKLVNLTNLSIDTDNLKISKKIGNLIHLKELELDCYSDVLPATIASLKKLENLTLKHVSLKSLENWTEMTSVKHLTLGSNPSFPSALNIFKNVESLKISGCWHGFPQFIYGLTSLKMLDIKNTMADQFYTCYERISSLTALESLTIDSCDLSVLPKNIGHLPLRKLIFKGSFNVIPKEIGSIKTLQFLTLSNNGRLPDELGELENIQYINISGDKTSYNPKKFTPFYKIYPGMQKTYYIPNSSLT